MNLPLQTTLTDPAGAPGAAPLSVPSDPPLAGSGAALAPGSALGALRVRRLFHSGSDEVAYVAVNEKLHRRFLVREYLPAALVSRNPQGLLVLHTAGSSASFLRGMEVFLEQAQRRSSMPQGVLLGVRRVWEENGTAYLCLPFPRAPSLSELRADSRRTPDEPWLRTHLLAPLLDALMQLHGVSLLHGALSADKVLMLPEGRTVLLDLAAGPRAGTMMAQGMAADLRGVAALAWFAVTGRMPPTAEMSARSLADALRVAGEGNGGLRYGDALLGTLGAALAPDSPFSNVQAFRDALAGEPSQDGGMRETLGGVDLAPRAETPAEPEPEPEPEHQSVSLTAPVANDAPVRMAPPAEPSVAAVAAVQSPVSAESPAPATVLPPAPPARPPGILPPPALATYGRPNRSRWVGGAAVLGLVALSAVGWLWEREQHEPTAAAPLVATAPPSVLLLQPPSAGRAAAPSGAVLVQPAMPAAAPQPLPPSSPVAVATGSNVLTAQAPASAASAQALPVAVPATPRAACGARSNFALYNCMQQQCRRALYTKQPQCQTLRESDLVE